MDTIGERIKMRREELGLTQDELAQKTGYTSRSSINKIEKGNNNLPSSKIAVFATVLKTTVENLMGVKNGFVLDYSTLELLDDYLTLEYSDNEKREIAKTIISDLPSLNSDGLKEVQKRIKELNRLDEYLSEELLYQRKCDTENYNK